MAVAWADEVLQSQELGSMDLAEQLPRWRELKVGHHYSQASRSNKVDQCKVALLRLPKRPDLDDKWVRW